MRADGGGWYSAAEAGAASAGLVWAQEGLAHAAASASRARLVVVVNVSGGTGDGFTQRGWLPVQTMSSTLPLGSDSRMWAGI